MLCSIPLHEAESFVLEVPCSFARWSTKCKAVTETTKSGLRFHVFARKHGLHHDVRVLAPRCKHAVCAQHGWPANPIHEGAAVGAAVMDGQNRKGRAPPPVKQPHAAIPPAGHEDTVIATHTHRADANVGSLHAAARRRGGLGGQQATAQAHSGMRAQGAAKGQKSNTRPCRHPRRRSQGTWRGQPPRRRSHPH